MTGARQCFMCHAPPLRPPTCCIPGGLRRLYHSAPKRAGSRWSVSPCPHSMAAEAAALSFPPAGEFEEQRVSSFVSHSLS